MRKIKIKSENFLKNACSHSTPFTTNPLNSFHMLDTEQTSVGPCSPRQVLGFLHHGAWSLMCERN